MTPQSPKLTSLGWTSFFSSQIDPASSGNLIPVRVVAVHRSQIEVVGEHIEQSISPFYGDPSIEASAATVGDWLLFDPIKQIAVRLLDRQSIFKRRAAGDDRKVQLIAANVDTLFIITSCNDDFNVARLERYLAMARDAEVTPVILITKADQTEDAAEYVRTAAHLLHGLFVDALDARDPSQVKRLAEWCASGQTIAFVGSSGVGKSTLVNSLLGTPHQSTQGIREGDAKGRHTTTGRTLHRLPGGGWLLDTPGMREIQLTDVQAGIDEIFADLVDLAAQCRFSDCHHADEPGCAVRAAIIDGALTPERLTRWAKLIAEETRNSATLAERRRMDRAFTRMATKHTREKRRRRDVE